MDYDDMSPGQKIKRNRVYLTLIIAASHFALATLGIVNRLSFSVPSKYELLQQTLSNPLWIVLHYFCGFIIIITLRRDKGQAKAVAAATGVMGAWAFLSLLWGLTTPTPVSLSGPVLGGGIATLSYLLTSSWMRAANGRGE